MTIRQCENGHFFDGEKYSACPICMQQALPSQDQEETEAFCPDAIGEPEPTVPYWEFMPEEIEPTVGWLVCIRGTERGKDWKITRGRNFAGSAQDADIRLFLQGRNTKNAFSVIYDERHHLFLLAPGEEMRVYRNGVLLTQAEELADDDEIGVEEMVLCFRSFCRGEKRCWK